MSQSTCDCDCQKATVNLPIRGISLDVDASAFGGQTPAGDGVSWSLEEQWTGKYWVDGKKVYQKTVDCGALRGSGTGGKIKLQPHGIATIKDIIDFRGRAWLHDSPSRENATVSLPHVNPNYPSPATYSVGLAVTPDSVEITTAHTDYSYYDHCYVTIWYTCTDR